MKNNLENILAFHVKYLWCGWKLHLQALNSSTMKQCSVNKKGKNKNEENL